MKTIQEFALIITVAFLLLNITIWVNGILYPENSMTTQLIKALTPKDKI